MLRRLIRRLGVPIATLALTFASVLVSIIVTAAVSALVDGSVGASGIAIAIIVPVLVAPPFTFQILSLVARLDEAESKLQLLAITDPLTQAFNRRHFVRLAEREFARVKRYGGVFSVMIFDIDDFKAINDTYGHTAGDFVLSSLTAVCLHESRSTDIFACYGGEEFVFLLPESGEERAALFAERIRQTLSQNPILYHEKHMSLTISVGVATYRPSVIDFDSLLKEADDELYAAKRDGKNRVGAQATTTH